MERPYGRFLFLESFKPSMLASESWILFFFKGLANVFVSFTTHVCDALGKHFCKPGLLLTLTPDFMHFANAQLSKCDFLLFVVYNTARDDSVQFSRSVLSDSLRPHGLQDARSPCPSPTPGVYSNSCPLSQWCYPTISSSVIPFSSHLQSFPASGSFPMSQLFTSDGWSIGVSASTSVHPRNFQDWSPLGWTGWISLPSEGLSRVFSNTTVQKHQFFCAQLSL